MAPTWLKKVGLDVLKIGEDVAASEPILGPILTVAGSFLPKAAQPVVQAGVSDLTLIAKEITTAEGMFAATSASTEQTGSQKLAAASPFVAIVVQNWINSGALGSKKIANPTAFQTAVVNLTSAFADLLNSLGD